MAKQKIVVNVNNVSTREEMSRKLKEIAQDVVTHYGKTKREKGTGVAGGANDWDWTITPHS